VKKNDKAKAGPPPPAKTAKATLGSVAKPKARPLGTGFSVVWKFDDGDMRQPLNEYISGRERDAGHLALLKDRARRVKTAAVAPRPGARSQVKARVEALMRSAKSNGSTFKDFLEAWGNDAAEGADGLRITLEADGKFLVIDENGDANDWRPYTLGSLDKMWGKA
jgi:hypothetical protein